MAKNNKIDKILTFNKEDDGNWYIDLPNWPLAHHNLMMVAGADELCEHFSTNGKQTIVNVIINPDSNEDLKPDILGNEWGKLIKTKSSLLGGATYKVEDIEGFTKDIWLCPVTLYVFKNYPDVIYIKKEELYESDEHRELNEDLFNTVINNWPIVG